MKTGDWEVNEMQNILAALFEKESEGFQAITELRQNPVADKYAILQMGLVKREGDKIRILDSFDSGKHEGEGAALGGLLGGLVGILGGPIGVLMMGSYGALIGGTAGALDSWDDAALLEMVASKMVDGEVALIALTDEEDESALDQCFSKFTVEIARYDAAAIAEEVDELEDRQAEDARLAVRELRQARLKGYQGKAEEAKEKIEADFQKLKDSAAETKEAIKESAAETKEAIKETVAETKELIKENAEENK